jgi:hypothetical protein
MMISTWMIARGTAFVVNNAQAFGVVLTTRDDFAFVQFQNGEYAHVPLLVVAKGNQDLKRHVQ